MKNLLRALPCFTQVESISTINSGLSQQSFKVFADNQVFFAKTINDNAEVLTTICANQLKLAPNIFYYDENWLINEFIDAQDLTSGMQNLENKITHAIKLMVQCHQLTVKPAELATNHIIDELINNAHYSAAQQEALLQLSQLFTPSFNHSNNSVFCHGDVNFSNILINETQETWLIDYECACIAPLEYDLAMFIAVNDIPNEEIITIVEQYQNLSTAEVNFKLLKQYLQFCYFINALWYFNACHKKEHTENKHALLQHAKNQWYALNSALNVEGSHLLSRLGIKLTNVLTTFDLSKQT